MIQKLLWKSADAIKLIICFLILTITFSLQGQSYDALSRLEVAQTPTFFSNGAKEQAEAMAATIDGALAFYSEHIDYKPNVTLLVLSPEDWGDHTSHPVYGMPHYTDRQTLIVAAENNAFWKSFLPPLENLPNQISEEIRSTYTDKDGKLNLRPFFDLIAIHELGHAYHLQGGLNIQRKWLGELFCNVFLHTYTAEKEPHLLPALTVFPTMVLSSANKDQFPYTTLRQLEENYEEITRKNPKNYGWYQSKLHKAAENIYEEGGIKAFQNFWDALKAHDKNLDNSSLVSMLSEEVHQSVADVVMEWNR